MRAATAVGWAPVRMIGGFVALGGDFFGGVHLAGGSNGGVVAGGGVVGLVAIMMHESFTRHVCGPCFWGLHNSFKLMLCKHLFFQFVLQS